MINKLRHSVIICIAIAVTACEFGVSANSRSGTFDDDYVAEPLSSISKKYENALVVSNSIVDYMKEGDTSSIYSDLFSDELKNLITREEFEKLFGQIIAAKGRIIKFKDMQWGFISGKEDGREFLGSVKIVEHEQGMMKYLFVFNDDGKFSKITGLQFKERDKVSPPGQF
jgi:hypothetical protein